MSEYKYLLMSFMIIFLIGTLTLITSSFADTEVQDYSGYMAPLTGFILHGYNFDITVPIPILPDLDLSFQFNPFSIFGSTVQSFLATQISTIGLLPKFMGIPILIILISSIVFFLIKLIQGFIP